ncbi:MAG: hypothetical protein ACTSWR_01620 [Candidatus Helarchaeota archaeon]
MPRTCISCPSRSALRESLSLERHGRRARTFGDVIILSSLYFRL